MNKELLLGVNIDHIATLRQARGTKYPDPVLAAMLAEEAGADLITLHMREDLRHIQARDVRLIHDVLQTKMNLELAVTEAMIAFAAEIRPAQVCLVPEKREELTTEGGLDVLAQFSVVKSAVQRLADHSLVSLFIDPERSQIEAAKESGATAIELHTGCYADAVDAATKKSELERIRQAAAFADSLHLVVNAGHGLHYHNVQPIARIPVIRELNIGHAIMARAFFCGLKEAVITMRQLMQEARYHVND